MLSHCYSGESISKPLCPLTHPDFLIKAPGTKQGSILRPRGIVEMGMKSTGVWESESPEF